MRGEVPDDGDVLLVDSEVHPQGGDEVDLAELAGLYHLPRLDDRGREEEGVPHHRDQLPLLTEFDEVPCLGLAGCERLLDENVLSRFEDPAGERIVRHRVGCDDDPVDRGIGDDLVEVAALLRTRIPFRLHGEPGFVPVTEDEPGTSPVGKQVPGEIGPPVAQAYHRNLRHNASRGFPVV
ncbi:MAG: hypothetical protein AO396_03470 [Candidatus Fermentibacter daniensis]|nr:MAG: hypothetical protein AO396_03470 [Candidatus Fermentibacter daniensis]KZD17993.1 MAG: hypothetical protein AO394_00430 [Candidatus Fermentibacter daniensis]